MVATESSRFQARILHIGTPRKRDRCTQEPKSTPRKRDTLPSSPSSCLQQRNPGGASPLLTGTVPARRQSLNSPHPCPFTIPLCPTAQMRPRPPTPYPLSNSLITMRPTARVRPMTVCRHTQMAMVRFLRRQGHIVNDVVTFLATRPTVESVRRGGHLSYGNSDIGTQDNEGVRGLIAYSDCVLSI